jgi:hypothetical protein
LSAPFTLGGLIMLPVLLLIGSTRVATRPAPKPDAAA